MNRQIESIEDLIAALDSIKARYQVVDLTENGGTKLVYVFEKDSYDKIHNHPRKYKGMYLPQVRFSRHEDDPEGCIYVRDNGLTEYWMIDSVIPTLRNGGYI